MAACHKLATAQIPDRLVIPTSTATFVALNHSLSHSLSNIKVISDLEPISNHHNQSRCARIGTINHAQTTSEFDTGICRNERRRNYVECSDSEKHDEV